MASVEVHRLSKHYQVHQKEPGLRGSVRSFFKRRYQSVRAIEDVSFAIQPGEMVGFLGPNGAGKTTTLKVLSGLLYPTGGDARVCGFRPFDRKHEFLREITLVMGQKNQLLWDLPPLDTFEVNRSVYEIGDRAYAESLDELTELLDIGSVLKKPVRKLSLGERMKCELAAALLHRPKVLFLDEPTIGLDVTMQARVREFLIAYNQRHGATILLTSHYMADVTALCKRVLVIDQGHLVYDGDLSVLIDRIAPHKRVKLVAARDLAAHELERYGEVQVIEGRSATLNVIREETSRVAASLFQALPIEDITIEDPEVEEIIGRIFTEKLLSGDRR